jgi:hypothetical protein
LKRKVINMAITDEDSDLTNDTTNPERCKNRKATITVSVTAVGANRKDTKKEAYDRAKVLKDAEIAEMKRTIHCPDERDICPPSFACFEDQPWKYTRVTPSWNITPDDEDKPTEWTATRSYIIKGSLRCECIRATLAMKDDHEKREPDNELEDLLCDT